MKFKNKLISTYLILSICFVVIIMIFDFFLKQKFNSYLIEKQNQKNLEFVNQIETSYNQNEGYNIEDINVIGNMALQNGLILKIENQEYNIIWDALVYHEGMCTSMIKKQAESMNKYHNYGVYIEKIHNIEYDNEVVGLVTLGYYGPYYYTNEDIIFLKNINKSITLTILLSLLLSIIIGSVFAKKINVNLKQIVLGTKSLFNHNFQKRLFIKTNINEFDELTDSINSLAVNAEKAKELRDKLTMDVAHELRTPLTIIETNLEAMIDGVYKTDKSHLKELKKEVNYLSEVLNNLEKTNYYESDYIKLNKTKFNIKKLIETQIKINKTNITLNGEDILIVADKNKLTSVVGNLISNAVKYSKDDINIIINIKETKDDVILEFIDNGIGIKKEHLPFIFERFYRVDESRNKNTGGSGIGLSIVKAIVVSHDGKIEVKSVYKKGSTFTVTLPKKISN